jgi:anti-sigma factor RsiW
MHENKDCQHLLGCLSEYIDGSLSQTLCDELEKHLAGCENCQIVIDSMRKTIDLCQICAEQETLPEEVRRRLFQCLNLEDYLEK